MTLQIRSCWSVKKWKQHMAMQKIQRFKAQPKSNIHFKLKTRLQNAKRLEIFLMNHNYGTVERSIFPPECEHGNNCLKLASDKSDLSTNIKTFCNCLRTETTRNLTGLKQKAEVSLILILFTLILYNSDFCLLDVFINPVKVTLYALNICHFYPHPK